MARFTCRLKATALVRPLCRKRRKPLSNSEIEIKYHSGEDGYYVEKKNPIFHAVVKTDGNPENPKVEEWLKFIAARVPGNIFRSWQAFGRAVADRNNIGSEAALIIFYNPEKKIWGAYPPKQDLSSVHVDYSGVTEAAEKFRAENGKEWMIAGTLHTHPGGAEPSFTDEKDEEGMDGIHFIVPDFGKPVERGVTCHITCSKTRFEVSKIERVINWDVKETEVFPEKWFGQLVVSEGGRRYGRGWNRGYGYYSGYTFNRSEDDATTWTGKVNGKDVDLLDNLLEAPELPKVLKMIGFSKKERKLLIAQHEDVLSDVLFAFDYARDALSEINDTRDPVTSQERSHFLQKSATATEACLDALARIANRFLGKKVDALVEYMDSKKEDEDDEDEDDGKEDVPRAESDGKIDRISQQGSEFNKGECCGD